MVYYSPWLGFYGWSIFTLGLIAAIILFSIKKKFSPVMYLVSVATYIFTVGFVIDAFDMGREGVLLLLALSAVLFIALGFYFSKKSNALRSEVLNSIPKKR